MNKVLEERVHHIEQKMYMIDERLHMLTEMIALLRQNIDTMSVINKFGPAAQVQQQQQPQQVVPSAPLSPSRAPAPTAPELLQEEHDQVPLRMRRARCTM
jgi:hypothetical protein